MTFNPIQAARVVLLVLGVVLLTTATESWQVWLNVFVVLVNAFFLVMESPDAR